MTQPSRIYSIGICQLGASRVAIVNDYRACGTTTNVVERSGRCASRKGSSVAPVDLPLQTRWLSQRGADSVAAMLNCCTKSVQNFEHLGSRQTNRIGGACGGRSTISSAVVVLHLPTSLCRNSTTTSTTKSMAFNQPQPAPICWEIRVFTPVTPADVIALMRSLPDKQCSSDLLSTWLLKINVDVLTPFLYHQ